MKKSMNVLKVQYMRLLDADLPSFVCLVLKGLKVNNACSAPDMTWPRILTQ